MQVPIADGGQSDNAEIQRIEIAPFFAMRIEQCARAKQKQKNPQRPQKTRRGLNAGKVLVEKRQKIADKFFHKVFLSSFLIFR